jgi:hypothetical protein
VLTRSSVARVGLDWSFRTGDSVISSPAVANEMVYIGSQDGHVYAFGLPGGLATPARAQAGLPPADHDGSCSDWNSATSGDMSLPIST